MRTIRWGIIGCGDVTEVKSGPGFQQAEHSRLVAVMRRNGALARDYAQRHGVPTWYDDAAALIHDPDVDAIYIATPPSSHKAYTLMSAQAGKPVYVEKPMALNVAECQAMIEACRDAGVPLFVAYYRRALPRFLKIKELIEAGAIGAVRSVSIAFYRPAGPAAPDPEAGAMAGQARDRRGRIFRRPGIAYAGLFGLSARADPLGRRPGLESGPALRRRGYCELARSCSIRGAWGRNLVL